MSEVDVSRIGGPVLAGLDQEISEADAQLAAWTGRRDVAATVRAWVLAHADLTPEAAMVAIDAEVAVAEQDAVDAAAAAEAAREYLRDLQGYQRMLERQQQQGGEPTR